MRILAVSLDGSGQTETKMRLTHRIAALFGVDLGEAPAGRTWATRYDALTVAEISRGGLYPSKEWHQERHGKVPLGDSPLLPKGTFWIGGHGLVRGTGERGVQLEDVVEVSGSVHEIAPATRSRFRPDRKAALVLTGSNGAFESVVPVFTEVSDLLRQNRPDLDRRTLLTVWALLVLECYRSQPLLFSAAVTAREIQRALTTPWAPVAGLDLPAARAEFGSATESGEQLDPGLAPRELTVLDATLRSIGLAFGPEGGAADESLLRDAVIRRWTKHLLESPDSGYVWLTEPLPGRRVADVLLSTVDSVTSLVNETWGRVGKDDVTAPAAWERLCPAVPSLADAERLSRRGQVALVWVLAQCLRMFRLDPDTDHRAFLEYVAERQRELIDLSAGLLGPVHPLTYFARNRYAGSQHRDLRHADPARAQEAGLQTSVTLVRLAELHQAGQVSGGFYAEILLTSAMVVRKTAADAATRGDDELAATLADEVRWLWEQVFLALHIDIEAEIEASADAPSAKLRPLAQHLHNYTQFLASSGDPRLVRRALELLNTVVIPSRDELARERGADRSIRLSLQVAISAVDALLALDDVTTQEREHWSGQAWRYVEWLRGLPYPRAALGEQRTDSEAEANTLARVVTGTVIALENDIAGAPVALDELRAVLARVADYRKLDLSGPAPKANSSEEAKVIALHARLGALEVVAEAQEILATATFGSSKTLALMRAGDESPNVHVIELDDATLFEALRGASRRRVDAWPTLELTWLDDGQDAVEITVDQPLLSPQVAAVSVQLHTGDRTFQTPLTWQVRRGHPVRLQGVVNGFPPGALETVSIRIVVRGNAT